MTLQEKALKHVIALLESIDMYPTYSAINDALSSVNVEERPKIMTLLSEKHREQTRKVKEAKEWLESLINT